MVKSKACKTCRLPTCKDCGKALRLHKQQMAKIRKKDHLNDRNAGEP